MTVQNFMKIVRTVFEKFEIFMKKQKKIRHDWLSSRKFFSDSEKTGSETVPLIIFSVIGF